MRPDYEKSWELAFGAAILELEAEGVLVRDIYQALHSNWNDLRAQRRALLFCFADQKWKWNLYKQPKGADLDYGAMASAFIEHITADANSLYRRDQLFGNTQFLPYWRFRATPNLSPRQCLLLDGTIHHFTDNFWIKKLPPCGRAPCRCYVEALSERDVSKLDP